MKVLNKPAFFDGEGCTYFRGSDVKPEIVESKAIAVYHGESLHRNWGRSFVSSHVLLNTATFCVVLIGWKNKHSSGQGWYFFEKKDGTIHRRKANQLSTRRRGQVMKAYNETAPAWAKQPIQSVKKPKPTKPVKHIRFKQVAEHRRGQFASIFDGSSYDLGKTKREKAQPDHGGGFYVYPSEYEANSAAFPKNSLFQDCNRAVLRCEVWGTCQKYDNGKESWSNIKPLEVVDRRSAPDLS